MSPLPLDQAIQHYKLFRDYVQHEDELINHRLSWNNSIQGLLFTAYGIAMGGLTGKLSIESTTLIIVLPVLGGLASFFSWRGVVGAQRAIATLDSRWTRLLGTEEFRDRYQGEYSPLPPLIGGGDEEAHKLGHRAPWLFPLLFLSAWVILFLSYILPWDRWRSAIICNSSATIAAGQSYCGPDGMGGKSLGQYSDQEEDVDGDLRQR